MPAAASILEDSLIVPHRAERMRGKQSTRVRLPKDVQALQTCLVSFNFWQ